MFTRGVLVCGCIVLAAIAITQSVQQGVNKEIELIPTTPTMADAAKVIQPKVKTAKEALNLLKQGNAIFYSGEGQRSRVNAYERRLQMVAQAPFAIVLSCSDSRVPPEIVFDQGPGDLFIVRIAGNAADQATLGSIDYAVEHLNCKLIVVMGHEACGAVKAAMLPQEQQAKESAHIRYLLGLVGPAVASMPKIRDDRAKMREAILHNVRYQVGEVLKDPVIQERVKKGEAMVVGAMYEIGSGAVDFLDTPEELRIGN